MAEPASNQQATHGGEGGELSVPKHPKLEAKTEDKPPETGKKKKLVRVDPLYIKALQVTFRKPYPVIPEEVLKDLDPEMQASLRAHTAAVISHYAKRVEEKMAILNQYDTKGYAEMEVTDDEDEEITDDEDKEV